MSSFDRQVNSTSHQQDDAMLQQSGSRRIGGEMLSKTLLRIKYFNIYTTFYLDMEKESEQTLVARKKKINQTLHYSLQHLNT